MTTAAADGVETLLVELTIDEKIQLLSGADFWHTPAITRLGIPALHLSDGPSGVRGARSVGTASVSFPCGSAIGATFDTAAAAKLANALADECLERGVHVLLGPTVNLHRHPLGGRHFECYSEDPVLSARLAVAYVAALQARGVAATVKHYVANDTEFQRHTISSDVGERVLHELYHLPFEAAVHDARAWAVMSSYNKVNGTYAAEHAGLLAGTLRTDWGFDGVVISDWFGTKSTVGSAVAGLDLEMPGPPLYYGDKLAQAAAEGDVSESVIDDHVRRLLTLAERTGALGGGRGRGARTPTSTVTERQAIARELAASSFVLLKNDGAVLPFSLGEGQLLAVIGPNAVATVAQGGGSAHVNPVGRRSVFQALHDRLSPHGVTVAHEPGCVTWSRTPALEASFTLEYFAGTSFDTEDFDPTVRHTDTATAGSFTWLDSPVPTDSGPELTSWVLRAHATVVPEETGTWTFSLAQVGEAQLFVDGTTVVDARGELGRGTGFYGLGSQEAFGTVDLESGRAHEVVVLYTKQPGIPLGGLTIGAIPPMATSDELLRRAETLASKADAVVCVVGTSAEWETEGHDRSSMDLPGLQDQLVRRLVLANNRTCVLVNAGSPVTMDWADDVSTLAQIWFGGEQAGEGVTDVLLGEVDPGGRLPTTIPRRIEDTPAFRFYPGSDGHAPYGENLLVGYRHYDTRQVEPRFCFGEGLSFTSFALSSLDVARLGPLQVGPLPPGLGGAPLVLAGLTVENTGDRAGSEVVQCYVHALDRRSDEPEQQLRAFEKLTLEAGGACRVEFRLTERDFARYDERAGGWSVRPGLYELRLGRSSRAIRLMAIVELA
ncbi:MAG: glycoside hydrolase family 3 C-terminal domain-containing protein [Acidimicrobiales bacterium]|jgi:beta-glucosidase